MMIKAFLFDLDGTLVNTHQANYEAYNKALNDIGINISYETFEKSIGYQADTFLKWFAPGLTTEEYKEIGRKKAEYYKDTASMSMLNIELIGTLRYLKKGHKIILVTTAKRHNAMVILNLHNIAEYFDDIVCAEDVEKSKPSPDCYKLALERNGLKAEEVIAFEDSEPGIQSATSAGISVVKVEDF